MEDTRQTSTRRRRGSIFWPLLLVSIGLVLLMGNLGILTEGTWDTLWIYWPLLLVLMGLDGIYRNEGLVGSAFISGLGLVFLLANLGYLSVDVWGLILRLWPILIIAIGFDIIIGRRSMWGSLIGFVLVLAVLAGALFLMGVQVGSIDSVEAGNLEFELGTASKADIYLNPVVGELVIRYGAPSDVLLVGQIPQASMQKLNQGYKYRGDVVEVTLENTGASIFTPMGNPDRWKWDIGLAEAIPLELSLNLGAGRIDADLSRLSLSDLQVDLGVGNADIVLPKSGSYSAQVDGAIGRIKIEVPEATGVRINTDLGLATVNLPTGFHRQGDIYYSPNYESSEQQIEIRVDLAIGYLDIDQ